MVPVSKIPHVEEPSPGHFRWPDLDVDLTREMIARPEWFRCGQGEGFGGARVNFVNNAGI